MKIYGSDPLLKNISKIIPLGDTPKWARGGSPRDHVSNKKKPFLHLGGHPLDPKKRPWKK